MPKKWKLNNSIRPIRPSRTNTYKDVLFIIGTGIQKYRVKKYLESQANLALEYKMKQGNIKKRWQ